MGVTGTSLNVFTKFRCYKYLINRVSDRSDSCATDKSILSLIQRESSVERVSNFILDNFMNGSANFLIKKKKNPTNVCTTTRFIEQTIQCFIR